MDSIPYGKQNITVEDIQSVVDTLRGAMITQGEKVPEFENQICKIVEAPYAVAVNSATSALHLACMAIGVGKNDWVWTSSTSFVASANCGLYCKAKVDFIDIENETGLIDPKKLSKKLKEAESTNKLPKVIVVVHLAGTSCEMRTIDQLAKRYGIKIIEDASHAIGGKYENYPVGSCMYSDITVFSFHPVKIITTGEGGALTTNNKEIFEKAKILRSHGIIRNRVKYYEYNINQLSFNYRLSDLNCALGISQIQKLDTIIKKKNKLFKIYCEKFKNLDKFIFIPNKLIKFQSHHLMLICIKNFNIKKKINLIKYLNKNRIFPQFHYIPLYKFRAVKSRVSGVYKSVGSNEYYSKFLSLPLFYDLNISTIDKVVKLLKNYLKKI